METEGIMAEKSRLIRMLRNRCMGRPYEVELYVTKMDEIMEDVFQAFIRTSLKEDGRGLDLETFKSYCWEKLENDRLVLRLSDLTFEDDNHLVRYTRKTFENLLREKAEELSPGFRARKKQVERVLKKRCLSICRKMCGCWKLSELRNKACEPADEGQIMEAAASLPIPELKPAKNPGSRAASLSDDQMAQYLTTILRAVGGMAKHKDVLSLISRQFNLFSIRIEPMPPDETEAKPLGENDLFLSQDHELMAREILDGMDSDMIDVHRFRVAKEMTIAETARQTGWSTGTVHNREKTYREYIRAYFQGKGELLMWEEMETVMRIVSREVAKIKRRS